MHNRNNRSGYATLFCLGAAIILTAAMAGCDDSLLSPAEQPSLRAEENTPLATESASSIPEHAVARGNRSEKIPGQYVVLFNDDVRDVPGLARQLVTDVDGEQLFTYAHSVRGFAVRMSDARAEGLARNPNVRSVTQDALVFTSATQPGATWGLDRIDQRGLPLSTSYSYDRAGAGVTAYILDTGIRYSHADFGGRAVPGADFVGGDGSDCNGHGTHVAGTVGGTVYGVAKQAKLVSVRVFGCSGGTPWSTVIAAMDWIGAQTARPAVVNMSLGGSRSEPINAAVAALTSKGISVIVAAGNDGTDACLTSPASAPSAVTVGATNSSDARASWSNDGACVDLFAPGVSITSAWHSGSVATISGTSMASPHVAGIAALILSENPSLTAAEVESVIKRRATKGVVQQTYSENWHLAYSGRDNDDREVGSPPPVVPPKAPSDARLEWRGTGTSSALVQLYWQDNSTDESSFDIRGYRVSDGVQVRVDHFAGSATTGERTIAFYLPAGTWRMRVAAMIGIVSSDWSNYAEICITSTLTLCEGSSTPPPPPPPGAELSAAFSTSCPANKNRCAFDGAASSSTASIVSYTWDFGDGSVESSSTSAQTNHTYKAKGSYTVKLTVRDSEGRTATAQKTVSIKSLAK